MASAGNLVVCMQEDSPRKAESFTRRAGASCCGQNPRTAGRCLAAFNILWGTGVCVPASGLVVSQVMHVTLPRMGNVLASLTDRASFLLCKGLHQNTLLQQCLAVKLGDCVPNNVWHCSVGAVHPRSCQPQDDMFDNISAVMQVDQLFYPQSFVIGLLDTS